MTRDLLRDSSAPFWLIAYPLELDYPRAEYCIPHVSYRTTLYLGVQSHKTKPHAYDTLRMCVLIGAFCALTHTYTKHVELKGSCFS